MVRKAYLSDKIRRFEILVEIVRIFKPIKIKESCLIIRNLKKYHFSQSRIEYLRLLKI